jgi:hypothetical protein
MLWAAAPQSTDEVCCPTPRARRWALPRILAGKCPLDLQHGHDIPRPCAQRLAAWSGSQSSGSIAPNCSLHGLHLCLNGSSVAEQEKLSPVRLTAYLPVLSST